MEITPHVTGNIIDLRVQGRLDGYWAGHLDANLADVVREGYHRIRLNLSQVSFLSSAGIGVIMKYYKQLASIHGSLAVVEPSTPVRAVLEITRLTGFLIKPEEAAPETAVGLRLARRITRNGTVFDVFDVAPGATLGCRAIGSEQPLGAAGFREQHCARLRCPDSTFALGVGAFGDSFADCRGRFGEFLAVGGAAAYLPTDGTNVPDYLIASGNLAPELEVLYALACEGRFARLARFDAAQTEAIALGDLASACLEFAGADAAGIVMVAESAGLVGAALRRSPAREESSASLFDHPGIRSWLSFTTERAFARSLTLAVGIVARPAAGAGVSQLRSLDASGTLSGHVHAAAFSFRPLKKGDLDLKETVATLFQSEQLLGVLHLLHDDRGLTGVGQSEFIRGACWFGPIDRFETKAP